MLMNTIDRRAFLKSLAAVGASSLIVVPVRSWAKTKARVVVIGGGFGGGTAAKYIRMMDPGIDVTLIEKNRQYVSCPLSNEVIAGERDIASLTFGYEGMAKRGVKVVHDVVTAVDPGKKTVSTQGGKTYGYDALVMSPGVEFQYESIEGCSKAMVETVPHAYKAGEQTLLLQKQVAAMQDGQVCIITVPPKPFRCPPGPYERAALIAWHLKTHGKTKSKVIILDSNDSFSKKPLFLQGWAQYYGDMIKWVPGAEDGKVTRVDVMTKTAHTGFGEHKADVLNVIPPHYAGKLATDVGLTNDKGWCPVDPMSMESSMQKGIYVVGDACIAGDLPVYDMPKSAHAASSQAKAAAAAIVARANGQPLPVPYYTNTCYSLVTPEHGFSVVHIYKMEDGKCVYVKEAGGISPVDAPAMTRKLEAEYALGWLKNITADVFS
jgi:sulfide dehydrogenase [flavocytochrome c] flavoprotein chain